MRLDAVVRALKKRYGRVVQKKAGDPWELVLWENVGYLVRDHLRAEAYRALEREVGLDPKAIARCKPKKLAKIIAPGGMLAEHRAEKVIECARVALKYGTDDLTRFPSIGEPGEDRILLLARQKKTLAPDSNALRVMARLGWIRENKNYGKMYRAAIARKPVPSKWPALIEAHTLLKVHGQATCTRKAPMCGACPLKRSCPKKGVK